MGVTYAKAVWNADKSSNKSHKLNTYGYIATGDADPYDKVVSVEEIEDTHTCSSTSHSSGCEMVADKAYIAVLQSGARVKVYIKPTVGYALQQMAF